MQRFTIKLSHYQKGKKLGFVLVDSFISSEDSYTNNDEMEEGVSNIRGGGGQGTPNTPQGHKTSTLEILKQLNKGGSLHSNFAKEAAEAEAVAQAAAETVQTAVETVQPEAGEPVQPEAEDAPPQDPEEVENEAEAPEGRQSRSSQPAQATQAAQATHTTKRKRQTQISISSNSSVFTFAKQLAELSKEQSDTLSFDPTDFRNVDKLIEWGTKEGNVPLFQTKSGLLPLSDVNTESMKFVISETIKGGDLVEKVQYTKVGVPVKSVIPNKTLRESSAQSYYRSNYYNTFQCEGKSAMDLANILRVEEHYPLYITFKRPSPPEEVDVDELGESGTCEPPRKRTRRSESTAAEGAEKVKNKPAAPKKDEVIELLDSSDEEDAAQVPQVSMEIDSTTDSPPSIPPPDPVLTQSFYDDDFVLTPYGAGKILSSRVERYASSDIDSEATIYKPSIIYTIDLHFGICHVPASQVKSIQGTSYTEKTIFTYQRAPLTAHDLLRLRPMTYLNDSIVNFYLKYLRTQYDENSKLCKEVTSGKGWDDLDGEGIHVFPTFAYTRIKNCMPSSSSRTSKAVRTKIWKELKTWTKSVDIFKKKLLIFPINEHLHWTCVFVCHPGRLVRRHAKDVKEVVKKMVKDENSKPVVVEGKSILKKEEDVKMDDDDKRKESTAASKPDKKDDDNDKSKETTVAAKHDKKEDSDKVEADHKPSNEETKPVDNKTSDPVVIDGTSITEAQRAEVKEAAAKLKGELQDVMKTAYLPKNGMYRPIACRKKDERIAKANAVKADLKFDNIVKEDEEKPSKVTTSGKPRTKDNKTDNKKEVKPSDTESGTDVKPEEKAASSSIQPAKPKYRTKWQCDFCGKEAEFYDYDEACEHEKICYKNVDWCMIHFDSGKHFKLHKTTEITGNIRKYLNAYYEAEYASTHPGISSINMKNMPSFTAAGLPQQDNTKDCGVYMLENAERMLGFCPVIDYNFVNKTKGETKQKFFGGNDYTKSDIEKKRDDIRALVETLRREKD